MPRNSRKVKFDDEPPARPPPPTNLDPLPLVQPPPPPAPVRAQSLNYWKNSQSHDHDNDEDHKLDLGPKYKDPNYKDPWVELYGKAVLDNSLQDRIEARRLKYASPTQKYVMEDDLQTPKHDHYSLIRGVVLKVLGAQGISNPSDEIIDAAITEYLEDEQHQQVI